MKRHKFVSWRALIKVFEHYGGPMENRVAKICSICSWDSDHPFHR